MIGQARRHGVAGVTLAIGPFNECRQAYFWAEAVTRETGIEAFSFAPASVFSRALPGARMQEPPHRSIPHQRLSTAAYRHHRIRRILRSATHVLAESFADLADRNPDAVVAHGSELRDPDLHLARLPHSYFRVASEDWIDQRRQASRINRAKAEGLVTFVSTPDLLLDCPTATWLPLTIDLDEWKTPAEAFQSDRPTVLHTPSRRIPPIKGTQYVDAVLASLAEEGKIRYLSPHRVPHTAMPSLVAQADVIVDQIMTGSYGVAAVEAMAAGRLVIGGVSEDVRALVPEEIPIVDATPTDFPDVIRDVLSNVAASRAKASQGVAYARRWHDGRESAAALTTMLTSR